MQNLQKYLGVLIDRETFLKICDESKIIVCASSWQVLFLSNLVWQLQTDSLSLNFI